MEITRVSTGTFFSSDTILSASSRSERTSSHSLDRFLLRHNFLPVTRPTRENQSGRTQQKSGVASEPTFGGASSNCLHRATGLFYQTSANSANELQLSDCAGGKSRMNFRLVAFCLLALLSSASARAQQPFFSLDSSNPAVIWEVKPHSDIANAMTISATDNSSGWVAAQVPGTVFTSYVNAGLEKDPNFGDNIYQVERAKYDRDFWYRTQFRVPAAPGRKIWLHFEGINRRGEIYFNGQSLGKLNGFMERGMFDISDLVRPDAPQCAGGSGALARPADSQSRQPDLHSRRELGLDAVCARPAQRHH